MLEQQRHALDGLKIADDEKQRRIELQKQIMNAVLTGQGWEGVPEATRKQADTAWFRSVLQWDPEPVVKKVDQPLLIMHGELDKQVPVAERGTAQRPGREAQEGPGDAGPRAGHQPPAGAGQDR